jgi:lipid A 4'-phosphatase
MIKQAFKKISVTEWTLMAMASLTFIFFNQIDYLISDMFYNVEEGFFYKGSIVESFLYKSVRFALIISYVIVIGLWIYNRMKSKNILNINGKKTLFLVLVLAIGSGLIVNAILKENWGRARPIEVQHYGGTKTFTPAFVLSDQKGNSFSSGHASAAFVFMAFAMLATQRRQFWMGLALGYGFLVGLARIVAGGHFFSDTLVSFFIIYITAIVLHSILKIEE